MKTDEPKQVTKTTYTKITYGKHITPIKFYLGIRFNIVNKSWDVVESNKPFKDSKQFINESSVAPFNKRKAAVKYCRAERRIYQHNYKMQLLGAE